MPQCFAVKRGAIKSRIDTNYYSPQARSIAQRLSQIGSKRLGELTHTCYRYPTFYGFAYQHSGIAVLKGENITRDGELRITNDPSFISAEIHSRYPKTHLRLGDLVMSVRGEVGKVGVVDERFVGGNINANTIRISLRREVDGKEVLPEFVWAVLNSSIGQKQIDALISGGVQETITAPLILDLRVPFPLPDIQRKLATEIATARETRRRKLDQAQALLAEIDTLILTGLRLRSVADTKRNGFAILARELHGPVNPARYMLRALENCIKGTTIDRVANILEAKVSPSNVAPREEWDWIRIDDLPAEPLEVQVVRTEMGADIDGALFPVEENDILLARLGPTIINRKFVLCPRIRRRTVASGEFLVLRCREGWNPTTVLWILRTPPFRELIYSKARGATPSRYRVNRGDLAALPFPQIDKKEQASLAAEIEKRLTQARSLRVEAAKEWEGAKANFERRLLGSET